MLSQHDKDMIDVLGGLLTDLMVESDPHHNDIGKPVESPLTIYRVEMPNGRGPYNSGLGKGQEIYDRLCSTHGHNWKGQQCWDCSELAAENHEQMGITEKAFKEKHGHAAYGCTSLEAIGNWFPKGARQYLRDNWHAKIVVYALPKGKYAMFTGHGEVVFSKPEARQTRTLDLVTFQ